MGEISEKVRSLKKGEISFLVLKTANVGFGHTTSPHFPLPHFPLPHFPMSQPVLVILFNGRTFWHVTPSGVCASLKVLLVDISGSVESRNKAVRALCASVLILWGVTDPLPPLPAARGTTALISAMDVARVKAAELCPSGNIEYAVVTDGADNASYIVKATAPGVVPLAGAAARAVRHLSLIHI